jgi:hypothetical protein
MEFQQQREQQYKIHVAMVNQDLPHLHNYFKEMRFERKHQDDLRHHHHRLGVDTFWRLARKHKEIDKLLAALRDEKVPSNDPEERRLARLKARRETWDVLEDSRFTAYLKERRFDREHWERLRHYHDWLGVEPFWRLARAHKDIEQFRLALSTEFRRMLLDGLDDDTKTSQGARPVVTGSQAAKPVISGLIEIAPNEYKTGKTTDSPSAPHKDDR